MNQFMQKEWREIRLLIPAMIVLTAVCFLGVVAYTHWYAFAPRTMPVKIDDVSGLVMLIFAVAVLGGAGIVAPEVGNGTLLLLSSLPISRRRILAVTVLISLLVTTAASAGCVVTVIAGCYGIVALHISTNHASDIPNVFSGLRDTWSLLLLSCLALYVLSCLASMLFDRTLTAIFVTVITCAIAGALLTMIFTAPLTLYVGSSLMALDLQDPAAICLGTLPFLIAVYFVFTKGETLRTNRRFALAATTIGSVIAGEIALICLAYFWLVW